MKYEPVHPENIRQVWPDILPGLQRVIEKGKAKWQAEDMYAALKYARATLYLATGERSGFFVLERKKCPHTAEEYVNVWALHAEPTKGENYGDVAPFVADAMSFIDGVTKGLGLKRITLEGRRGWEAMLKDYFKPRMVLFERSL